MTTRIGYLLPTRENVMEGRQEATSLLSLAARAEDLGYDSIWVGDSLLARPRHEPLSLLAAVAGRTKRVELGTAVLLPALRNPVLLAHQVSTLDQISEGRTILGVGIATDVPNVRAEFEAAGVPFEKRVGRMLEGLRLCKALWTGETVDWEGRWSVKDARLGPVPYRTDGPSIWLGGGGKSNVLRVGREFDGWFPNTPDVKDIETSWKKMRKVAGDSGRDLNSITCAAYLTLSIDDDTALAESRVENFLSSYYGAPANILRKRQACYAGNIEGVIGYLKSYIEAGVSHIVLRFTGDHERHLRLMADVKTEMNK